jgi:hypothetical protein
MVQVVVVVDSMVREMELVEVAQEKVDDVRPVTTA